jgi:hypothetical protein
MSQHLNLQLEQKHRSDLIARHNRAASLTEEHKDYITVLIDKTNDLKVPPIMIKDKPPYLGPDVVDSALESDEGLIEDTSLLKMDVHIIPLEKVVERFNSNLTTGLTDDIVTQHHATFGQNKLTPSPPPSLLWMFIKQMLIGFNGILWLATLFAFLSYVSSLDFSSIEKNESFVLVETVW